MDAYWSQSPPDLLRTLRSSATGLTHAEAERRLSEFGANRLSPKEGQSALRLFLRQYQSPLVLILIFGALVSLGLGDWTDAAIIMAIVLGSTILGFGQEYRATVAVQSLRERIALTTVVVRDGQPLSVDARLVVPGDVILLSAGNLVPADGVVIEARDFLVTQAALTGESFPVEKSPGVSPVNATIQQRNNAVFLGTSVRSGTAKALVARTGQATELGGLGELIADAGAETSFERGLRKFGYLLTRIMTIIVMFVFASNLAFHRPLIESLLFAVALAVGLTPELLPAIVSVTLAAGARRMAKRGVIVRHLPAIENLGSADIVCTDKTGTLTKGNVELDAAVDLEGEPSDAVFGWAAVNAAFESGIENPLDVALVAETARRGLSLGDVRKIDEIPYDFVRKRLTIAVAIDGDPRQHVLVMKGAFDTVIACCENVAGSDGPQPLQEAQRQRLSAYYSAKGEEGCRVLAVATKRVPAQPRYGRSDEAGMVFEGFLLFLDPLKEGIDATIRELARSGIAVKIISGDNRHVTAHVAAAIGLDPSRLLTGSQMRETRDEALWYLAERTDVFAEVDPQQKERIVLALQQRGHTVAYMGDGINDAPALRAADVGISVEQAVDVARETADIVLLQQDLNVLHDGVIDGRRTFANTFKYVAITTSANFGNMISMALGTLLVPFLPLLAKQILLNNFLSDIPAVALSADNVDPEAVERAEQWDVPTIQRFMIVFGLISTTFDLMTFIVLLFVFEAGQSLFQSTWFVVSLLTELGVVLLLRTHLPAWRSRPSRLLVALVALMTMVAVGLPYTGLARIFGFVPIPMHLLATSLLIVALYMLATEAAKAWFYRRTFRNSP